MVKHYIIWKLKADLADKNGRKAEIKQALEDLQGKIDGLVEMHILTDNLPSSAGDIMMDSTFASVEALAGYQKNPLHVAVADSLVRPSVEVRLSFDTII